MTTEKPELTLVKANDADAIIAAFIKATGKTPTQAEIDDLRAAVDELNAGEEAP